MNFSTSSIIFDPLLQPVIIAILMAIVTIGTALALWRGLSGWALRGSAGLVLIAALLGPTYQRENRKPLSDIVLMLVDSSASQKLADRSMVSAAAAKQIETLIAERPNTELRRIDLLDSNDDSGTNAMSVLRQAIAKEPRARIAGAILISDGRIHDIENAPLLPAPLHLLVTGHPTDWDRRLIVTNAPAFAILGEEITLTLKIEDQGAAPNRQARSKLEISVDGGPSQTFTMPVGREFNLPVTLSHAGRNVIRFSVPAADGELTNRNNSALVQINGVRDRLRVLLVSGEPHAGGRTWRNLLKSDSSVDLVHFTILRPPEKQDGVPVSELSLIAFPTRELFLDKISDFDLIVFDRYKRRGILPASYLENVVNYVRKGGAVLISAGPDFASADSLYRSPLSSIIPAHPSARVIEQGYLPKVTAIGQRHPVTQGLRLEGAPEWGRWMRQIEVEADDGHVVMSGFEDRPLIILNRVGKGRVALIASDHSWLWDRGFEGGGPQAELLRRLAHWMMKEPELEEEALWVDATGQHMRIIRRTLKESADVASDVTITTPSGKVVEHQMIEVSPGRFEAEYTGPEIGLYRLSHGDHDAIIGLGPTAPREFEQTIATTAILTPLIKTMRGGSIALSEGIPSIRNVRMGRVAAGRGWIGLTPRDAYAVQNVHQIRLLPEWLVLLLTSALIVGAWLREGRR